MKLLQILQYMHRLTLDCPGWYTRVAVVVILLNKSSYNLYSGLLCTMIVNNTMFLVRLLGSIKYKQCHLDHLLIYHQNLPLTCGF